MRHPAGITHTTSLSTKPRAGRDRPSLFLRLIAWVLMATISTSSFAQAVGPMARGGYGQPYTGFTKNGTFVQGGVVVGNPHQEQHDLLKPGLWTTAAASFTNSTDPSFIQSNLADIEASIAVTPEPGGRAMSRLYITIPPAAPTANPYLDPSAGAPGCDPATTCNQAIYNQLLLDAQANGYSSVGNDGLGASTHIAKTHDSSSDSIYNRGFGSYQNKPVFQAAENPEGGATAFFLLQDAAAASHLRVLQNQSVANLGGLIFYTQQTLKGPGTGLVSRGYDGEVYDPGAEFDRQVGSAPSSLNRDSHNGSRGLTGYQVNPNGPGSDFQIGYIQPDGQAHAFDLVKDPHFRAFQNSAGYGAGEYGSDLNAGNIYSGNNLNNALLGANLRTAAIQNQKGQQAVANLSFEWAQDDRALFYQGINLYNYGNKADNALLRQLELGQITAGSADHVRARALAEQRFREAYAAQVEYELKAKFTKEGAKYQAEQLKFDDFDSNKLFNSGLNLFDKKGDPEQERLLRALQAGNLKPGDARYDEIRGLAEARYRVAYQKALEPPKKANPWKQIVGVVIAAVAIYFGQAQIATWAMNIGSAVGATSTFAVNAIATGISASISTSISTTIATGSLEKGLTAGLKAGATGLVSGGLYAMVGGGMVGETIANALAQKAVYGGDLGDLLVQGAINGVVDTLAANVAEGIGSNLAEGSFENYAAHAVLGCATGAARSGNSEGCGVGAAGAVVGNFAGQQVKGNLDGADPNGVLVAFGSGSGHSNAQAAIFFSNVAGGVAGALVGDKDKVQANFNLAGAAGQNAFENNFLKHEEANAFKKEVEACKAKSAGCSDEDVSKIVDRYKEKSNANIEEMKACVLAGSTACVQKLQAQAATSGEVSIAGIGGQGQIFEQRAVAVQSGNVTTTPYSQWTDEAVAKNVGMARSSICGGLSSAACDSKIINLRGEEQAKAAILLGGALTGTALMGELITAGPALAAAAKTSTTACLQNVVLCANNAGLALTDLLAGDALGGASVAGGLTYAGAKVKQLGEKLDEIKDAFVAAGRVGANGGVPIPTGFKPFNVEGLPTGSTGVVNAATGEVRVLTPTGALADIPATQIPANISASVVPQTTTGIKWGGGIAEQGLPFETYLAETTMPAGSRLPTNFKTFDFFDVKSGVATSAKTLDTMTTAKIADPVQVFTSLKGNVDTVAGFNQTAVLSGAVVNPASITARELQIAVPAGTTPAQWAQINKAIQYGQSQGVTVKVTVVKP